MASSPRMTCRAVRPPRRGVAVKMAPLSVSTDAGARRAQRLPGAPRRARQPASESGGLVSHPPPAPGSCAGIQLLARRLDESATG